MHKRRFYKFKSPCVNFRCHIAEFPKPCIKPYILNRGSRRVQECSLFRPIIISLTEVMGHLCGFWNMHFIATISTIYIVYIVDFAVVALYVVSCGFHLYGPMGQSISRPFALVGLIEGFKCRASGQ